MKERIIVIDTETTGVEPQDQVIETCAVEVDLSGQGKHTVLLDTLVQPTIPIGAAAMGTHHITEEEAAQGRPFAEVEEAIDAMKQEGKTVFAAHNAAFDRGMLRRDEGEEWIDTVRLSRHAFPDAPNHKVQTLRYHLGLAAPQGVAAHRARCDAFVTAELLAACIKTLGIGGAKEALEQAAKPVRLKTVPFGKHRGKAWEDVPVDYLLWMDRNEWDDPDVRYTYKVVLQAAMSPGPGTA